MPIETPPQEHAGSCAAAAILHPVIQQQLIHGAALLFRLSVNRPERTLPRATRLKFPPSVLSYVTMVRIGVLALQGSFQEHIEVLKRIGASAVEVRTEEGLLACDGLIIPGGESTTMAHIASGTGMLAALKDFVVVQKKPVWGTCAGLIFLAETAEGAWTVVLLRTCLRQCCFCKPSLMDAVLFLLLHADSVLLRCRCEARRANAVGVHAGACQQELLRGSNSFFRAAASCTSVPSGVWRGCDVQSGVHQGACHPEC